jgi:phytoene dehydrogenase-like protein
MLGKLFDVAIIGNELAGLTAGALLVKRGFQVVVIDVENARLQVKRDGYTLRPFPGLFYGFGQGQVFSDIFLELGIPFLEKKRFQMAQPAYQVAMPEARVDIVQGREEWTKLLHSEFGADAGGLLNMLNEMDRYNSLLRRLLTHEQMIYPPATLREKWRINRACSDLGADFKEGIRLDYNEFLDSFHLSATTRAFLDAQYYFLAPVFPDNPSLFFASFIFSYINKGIFNVEGGLRVLEDICKERISSYRGQLQRAGEIESVDFGRVNEIQLGGVKEPVRAKKLLVCTDVGAFLEKFAAKSLKGAFRERLQAPPPRRHTFTLFVAIDGRVAPVGMRENVILLTDPSKSVSSDNLAFVSISPTDNPDYAPAGKRLLAATTVVEPESGELTAPEARRLAGQLLNNLRDLAPFLDDFTEFVAYDESFALYQAIRRSTVSPAIDPEDRFGIACLPNRTPHKEVFYAGKGALPGLGMEGEGFTGLMAAQLLVKELS